MALVLKRAATYYNHLTVDLADKRLQDYPLVASPVPIFAILVVYLFFVFKWGPLFMKDRKPFNLKIILMVYNVIQMISSLAFVALTALHIRFDLWYCYPIPPANFDSPTIKYMGYFYFLLKICDLLDTVFFVLKKNYRQVTVLHLFHHTLMVFFSWIGIKYYPGGASTFLPFINSMVHFIMYGYYLLTAYDPKYKSNITCKRQITHIQLIQFGILFVLHLVPLLNNCSYPRHICYLQLGLNTVMFMLFSNFYYQTYVKQGNNTKKSS